MSWFLDRLFGEELEKETASYVRELEQAPVKTSRKGVHQALKSLQGQPGPRIHLGSTTWDEPVAVPISEISKAFSMVTGGTGSGKSTFALLIIRGLLEQLPATRDLGFGILDPKGDLFHGAVYLLKERLDRLAVEDPGAREELLERLVIYDFSSKDPVSSYNILARWPGTESDFFAFNRADLLIDLLEGDRPSLGGLAVLQKLLLLLSEFQLPITSLDDVLHDEGLRNRLLARCRNRTVRHYFSRHFPKVPKSTVEALRRRIDALFASEGVRLALSGNSAPDFKAFQDEGKIVLINCFGETISRGVRKLLQGLVLSDIRQSVFARNRKDNAFLWFCDEAQHFFSSPKLREHMSDLLTMARSFGTHLLYLTQNMSTAVPDKRMLKILYTNIRWSFSMRGEPSDCEFLRAALPVTGRKLRPQADPFAQTQFQTLSEERTANLEGIANLPDREGYLWLKSRAAEAFLMRTADLHLPAGSQLQQATELIRNNPLLGGRLSREAHDLAIQERKRLWLEDEEEPGELAERLEEVYRRNRGTGR